MMPPGGAPARAQQLATLERLSHDARPTTSSARWLEELEGGDDGSASSTRDLVRIARRDWERARRVPRELAAELAQAARRGQDAWQTARAADDFAAFAPALERNVELARAYAACFDEREHPYDALLADYDFGLTAARVREVFGRARRGAAAARRRGAGAPAPRAR